MVFFDSCFYQTLKYFYLKKSKNVSFWNIFYSFFVNIFRQGQSFLRRCQTLTLKENVGKKKESICTLLATVVSTPPLVVALQQQQPHPRKNIYK